MSARAFRGLTGDPSGQRVHKVVEGGAGTNHRFRFANHHVLDTLLGQAQLRITFGGHLVAVGHHGGEGSGERQGHGGGPDGLCNADLLQCFYNGWQSNANVTSDDVQVDWAHT